MTSLREDINVLVVKIGTSSLMKDDRTIDRDVLRSFVDDIAELWKQGKKIVIVTSGARGLGKRGDDGDMRTAAMRGQPILMHTYFELFGWHGIEIGQLLLTKEQFATKSEVTKTTDAIKRGFNEGTVVIINENDPITTLRTTMGDNDALAARVACGIGADALVMLSMENSTYKGAGGGDAKARAIREVEAIGIRAFVIDGKLEHSLRMLFDGDKSGTTNVERLRSLCRVSVLDKSRSKNRT
jgi:glutamate 5-kinase